MTFLRDLYYFVMVTASAGLVLWGAYQIHHGLFSICMGAIGLRIFQISKC